jgi:transposase
MNQNTQPVERVVGLDAHPDSFTAALIRGPIPAGAVVEKVYNQVPLGRLKSWAEKETKVQDLIVLEASGNSFYVVRTLAAIQRRALVLESCHLGKLKEAHANNDRISAVRIGKAYLAGTAKTVWVPDRRTQERRDWFHAYRKAVKRTTQVRNRLRSYLSDQGVRVPKAKLGESVRTLHPWTTRQLQVISGLLLERRHAEEQRAHWRSLMAQEVIEDPVLLSLVRLCGIRDIVAFALGCLIGDIHRFDHPKKLVSYVGLQPAFDDSGTSQWQGGLSGHGRCDLRALLIEAAQSIMRSTSPLAKWGRRLMAKKGSPKLAVAAVARKLTVSIWYLMMGRWSPLEEIDVPLTSKVVKIVGQISARGLEDLGKSRKVLCLEVYERLKTGRKYTPTPPTNQPPPDPKKSTLLQEYGLG